MDYFKPHGTKSYAEMFTELVWDLPTGSVISFDDPRLSFSIRDQRHVIRSVSMRLERDQSRTLAPVRGVGYKIVSGSEHEDQAWRDAKRTRRSARRFVHRASTIDKREMTGAEQLRNAELIAKQDFYQKIANDSNRKRSPESVIRGDE